jgi:hypothetical protein
VITAEHEREPGRNAGVVQLHVMHELRSRLGRRFGHRGEAGACAKQRNAKVSTKHADDATDRLAPTGEAVSSA